MWKASDIAECRRGEFQRLWLERFGGKKDYMNNASFYFKLNERPLIAHCSLTEILEYDSDEEFKFLKQFFLLQYTPANLNFC